MDVKSEAEKRWPGWVDGTPLMRADLEEAREHLREGFLAGAVWALREFGDLLDAEVSANVKNGKWKPARDVALLAWHAEAHHIADGIEGQ